MKKFLAALLIVGMIGFVGCKDDSTEKKVDDAATDVLDKAKDMKKDGEKKMDEVKKEVEKK
jgi:hypothetical protein